MKKLERVSFGVTSAFAGAVVAFQIATLSGVPSLFNLESIAFLGFVISFGVHLVIRSKSEALAGGDL